MSAYDVIVICGPTASGKTALSVDIAEKIGGEIVSADSMQIYKEMNIGTAKPDISERKGIPHHNIDIISVSEEYNVSKFVETSQKCIDDIISRGKTPVIVGGTGLYIDSLINNVSFVKIETDLSYREYLNNLAAQKGNAYIHNILKQKDPVAAGEIHPNNLKRVIDLKLEDERLRKFLRGEEIDIDENIKGYTGVAVEGILLGFGKASNMKLKNKYPKGLRVSHL